MSGRTILSQKLEADLEQFKRNFFLIQQEQSKEPIHQVRVKLRRILSFLDIAQAFLPKKAVKQYRQIFGRMIDVFSKIRDLDIQQDLLRKIKRGGPDQVDKRNITILIQELKSRQQKLKTQSFRLVVQFNMDNILKHLWRHVSFFRNNTLIEDKMIQKQCCHKIQKCLKDFLVRCHDIYRPKHIHRLHKLRIFARRLRYALETSDGLFARPLKPFIVEAESIQQSLGKIHDGDVCLQILEKKINGSLQNKTMIKTIVRVSKKARKLRTKAYRQLVRTWENTQEEKLWESLQMAVK